MGVLVRVSWLRSKLFGVDRCLITDGYTALAFMFSWSSRTISSVGA